MGKLREEEQSLKEEIDEKEKTFQEKARHIKFDDDDEHSRHEHELDVLQKSREKLEAQVNIEQEEIKNLNAKLDVRRIVQADEKKSERRQAVAEHEAELIKEFLKTEETVKIAKPVIDRDQPPMPDLEPSLPKSGKVEPPPPKPAISVLPVSATPDLSKAKTVVKDKSTPPGLSKPAAPETSDDKSALPELPTLATPET
jgi:LPS O-antigen subunit length determinant protein (WzzB/FepE family)